MIECEVLVFRVVEDKVWLFLCSVDFDAFSLILA
jgi:hypothetical protein